MKLLISPTYLSKRLRNWNNNTIRIIERVCHKCDDMPSFFFRYFSHFCQLTQPLHSANSAISFCKQIRLILLTNSNLRANEVISSSQRSHIFKPAQSNLQASAVGSLSQRSRMYRLNETYELAQWRTWFHQLTSKAEFIERKIIFLKSNATNITLRLNHLIISE